MIANSVSIYTRSLFFDYILKSFSPSKEFYHFISAVAFLKVAVVWVYFFAVKFCTNVRICSKNFGHMKIFSARFINERFYKFTKSNVTNYSYYFTQKHFQKYVLAQYFTTSLISKAANCFRFLLKSRVKSKSQSTCTISQ